MWSSNFILFCITRLITYTTACCYHTSYDLFASNFHVDLSLWIVETHLACKSPALKIPKSLFWGIGLKWNNPGKVCCVLAEQKPNVIVLVSSSRPSTVSSNSSILYVNWLWCCWLGFFTCKTVSRKTYTVLVETLNPAKSNPINRQHWIKISTVST